ncbi:hypothetical protein [Sulfitobacter sp.]|uniref:hypothetical protein n=1 Tax=Sulfitobacter sp. TaxID=1903071 RepID=UPI00272BCBD7|nr:hypothetical protein [Sulfitobacter sp.]
MEHAPLWMKHTERALDGLSFLCMLAASIAIVVLIVNGGAILGHGSDGIVLSRAA